MIKLPPYGYLALSLLTSCWPGLSHADVSFTGLNAELEANARALMPLASSSCDSTRWRVERLFRDSGESLGKALQAKGYYGSSFSKTITWTEECWHAVFDIQPGLPVRYREVKVQVNGPAGDDPDLLLKLANNRPEAGDVLDHGRYEKYKNSLISAAIASGYFDARYEQNEVLVDREAQTADLALKLESGQRYRMGELSFTEGIIRNELLNGYSDFRPGDLYRAETVSDLYEALNASSYFSSVNISTEPINTSEKTVPVKVSLVPAPRRIYSIGVGFATDTGPQGRVGFNNRRINDRGHQLEARMFGSSVKSEITTSYRWPRSDPRKEWFSIAGGAQHEETDTSESDTIKLGLLYSRNLSSNWLETRYVDYVREDFVVDGPEESSELVIFGINWESVKGRELSRTGKGRLFNLDIRAASDSLGSDTSFLQIRATSKWVHSLSDDYRVLARAKVGLTSKDRLDELPASVRFFAGGDRSIRGYGFETLGPADSAGKITGGSYLLEGSLELERLIRDDWALAVFLDTGSAFNDSDIELSSSIGLGVRWYSPVGPVRFDLAHPLDDPDRSLRIHIILGPDL